MLPQSPTSPLGGGQGTGTTYPLEPSISSNILQSPLTRSRISTTRLPISLSPSIGLLNAYSPSRKTAAVYLPRPRSDLPRTTQIVRSARSSGARSQGGSFRPRTFVV